jgi:hypothetical protein
MKLLPIILRLIIYSCSVVCIAFSIILNASNNSITTSKSQIMWLNVYYYIPDQPDISKTQPIFNNSICKLIGRYPLMPSLNSNSLDNNMYSPGNILMCNITNLSTFQYVGNDKKVMVSTIFYDFNDPLIASQPFPYQNVKLFVRTSQSINNVLYYSTETTFQVKTITQIWTQTLMSAGSNWQISYNLGSQNVVSFIGGRNIILKEIVALCLTGVVIFMELFVYLIRPKCTFCYCDCDNTGRKKMPKLLEDEEPYVGHIPGLPEGEKKLQMYSAEFDNSSSEDELKEARSV